LDLDAPVQLVRCVVADLLSDRRNFSAAVRNYLDLRSTAKGAGAIPTRSIFEVVPDATSTQVKLQNFFEIPIYQTGKTYPMIETGGVAARESCYLVMLLGTTKAKTIIEFGTSYGDTTLLLALNSPPDAVVLTTDLPEWSAVGIKFMEPDANPKVQCGYARTQDWDLSAYRGATDFVFIDAGHAYDDIVADSRKALDLLAPGGIICWHDYRFKFRHDVVKALDDLHRHTPLIHLQYTSLVFYRRP
jgi:predicted O-methyltransferase YrrM